MSLFVVVVVAVGEEGGRATDDDDGADADADGWSEEVVEDMVLKGEGGKLGRRGC